MKKPWAIVSGGRFSPLADIEKCGYIIACDRGYEYLREAGLRPDLLVGDFDSYTGPLPRNVPRLDLPVEKDDTDTMAAIRHAVTVGCGEIWLYCAMGGILHFNRKPTGPVAGRFFWGNGGCGFATGALRPRNDTVFYMGCGAGGRQAGASALTHCLPIEFVGGGVPAAPLTGGLYSTPPGLLRSPRGYCFYHLLSGICWCGSHSSPTNIHSMYHTYPLNNWD
jgi:hypothetical protein